MSTPELWPGRVLSDAEIEQAKAFLVRCDADGIVPQIIPGCGVVTRWTEDASESAELPDLTNEVRRALVALGRHIIRENSLGAEDLVEGAAFRIGVGNDRRASVVVREASLEEAARLFARRLDGPPPIEIERDEADRLIGVLMAFAMRSGARGGGAA